MKNIDQYSLYNSYFCDVVEAIERTILLNLGLTEIQNKKLKQIINLAFVEVFRELALLKTEAKVYGRN